MKRKQLPWVVLSLNSIVCILLMNAVPAFASGEQIFIEKCASCHAGNTAAPFSFSTYNDICSRKMTIAKVVQSGYMPPWQADTLYSRFTHERVLTQSQKDSILSWVNDLKPSATKIPIPVNASGKNYDLAIRFGNAVTTGKNLETFSLIRVPFELKNDTSVYSIELMPGQPKLLHHARYRIFSVPDDVPDSVFHKLAFNINLSYDEYATHNFPVDVESFGAYNFPFIYQDGWAPGVTARIYRDAFGFTMPRRGFVVADLHYSATPEPITDNSSLLVKFKSDVIKNALMPMMVGPVTYPKMVIYPDSIQTFTATLTLEDDMDLYCIAPHMHLLGKEFYAFAHMPDGSKKKLIHIPQWNFYRQEFYNFDPLVYLPAGTVIEIRGVFDNTSNNPYNPYVPPRLINSQSTMLTKDEMLELLILAIPHASFVPALNRQ